MKSIQIKVLGTSLLLLSAITSFSQVNWTINGNGNTTGGTNFLGTTNNQSLNFRTNNVQRMIIDNGGTGNAAGRALFSNDATGITPATRLHLHQTAGAVSMVFNNNATGTLNTDGMTIGISAAGDAFFINNELRS